MTLDQKLRQTADELHCSVSGRRPEPTLLRRNARGPMIALATAASMLLPVIVISAVAFNRSEPELSGPASSPVEQPELTTTSTNAAPSTTITAGDGLSEADHLPPGWDRLLGENVFLVLAEDGVALAVSKGDGESGFTTWVMGAQAEGTVVDVAGKIPDTALWVETADGQPAATVFGLVEQGTTSVQLQLHGVTYLSTDRIYQRPEIGRAVFIGSFDPSALPGSWSNWQITTTSSDDVMSVVTLDTPDAIDDSEGVTVRMLLATRPLVVGSIDVDALPEATLCQAPDDIETPPNKGEELTAANAYPTPEAALDAFIAETASQHHLATSGYVELRTSNGLIGYGIEFDSGPGFVTVVSIDQTEDGWTVNKWEASGC